MTEATDKQAIEKIQAKMRRVEFYPQMAHLRTLIPEGLGRIAFTSLPPEEQHRLKEIEATKKTPTANELADILAKAPVEALPTLRKIYGDEAYQAAQAIFEARRKEVAALTNKAFIRDVLPEVSTKGATLPEFKENISAIEVILGNAEIDEQQQDHLIHQWLEGEVQPLADTLNALGEVSDAERQRAISRFLKDNSEGLRKKLNAYFHVAQDLELEGEMNLAKAEKIKSLGEARINRSKRLLAFAQGMMEKIGITRLPLEDFEPRLQRNSTPPLHFDDTEPQRYPARFQRVQVKLEGLELENPEIQEALRKLNAAGVNVRYDRNHSAIRDALKKGEDLGNIAFLGEQGYHMRGV